MGLHLPGIDVRFSSLPPALGVLGILALAGTWIICWAYCKGWRRGAEWKIAGLEREADAMPRKPLTDAQLEACKAANGDECPRCGNESFDDDDLDFSNDAVDAATLDRTCDDCGEKFRLVYKLDRVEGIGG